MYVVTQGLYPKVKTQQTCMCARRGPGSQVLFPGDPPWLETLRKQKHATQYESFGMERKGRGNAD